jgi:hypothetical protein
MHRALEDRDPNSEFLITWTKFGSEYQKWAVGKREAMKMIAEVEAEQGTVKSVERLD